MTLQPTVEWTPVFAAYVAAFSLAALACFGSVFRARRLRDADTSRGLVWLLVLSGGWAMAHVLFLLVPSIRLKTALYVVGLVVGFAAVGPWLYFCSAYTGRSLHRNPYLRRAAVAVFLIVVAMKVTNPLHQLYFTVQPVSTPFPHLAVTHGLFHWVVMGVAYALAAIGYFMLLELFLQVSYDTTPLVALVTITGLPIGVDLVGLLSPTLIEITYEPIGVAIFAVGVTSVYLDRFQAIQLAGESRDPVILLDDDDRIREVNDAATRLLPGLSEGSAIGRPINEVAPRVAEALRSDASIIAFDRAGTTRYYQLAANPFSAAQTPVGRQVTLTDVTHRERYRRELERQNERLEQFAGVLSHDLRNPLTVASGRLELARDERDSEHLESVADALDRMEALIADLIELARQGQPIDETQSVDLGAIADQCWQMVESHEADLVIEDAPTLLVDPDRLQQLLENLFRNAIEHGGPAVTITVGSTPPGDGFYVADDGPGIPETERDAVFDSGFTTADTGTGFGLAIVEEIVDAHGWSIEVTESEGGGARFTVTGITSGE